MRMSALPFMLELSMLNTVIVGGGQLAYKRALSIIEAGGHVTVVAPTLHPQLHALALAEKLRWEARYVSGDECFLADLLFLCTDQPLLHQQLLRNRAPRQLVYVGDQAQAGHVYVPAKIEKGLLTVSISTAGASPSYTKRIKGQIANILPEHAAEELAFLQKARELVLASNGGNGEKRALLQELASAERLQDERREQWLDDQLRRIAEDNQK
ncbi:hypothetical protein CHH72_12880 [Shouchella clausii]|uniref:precorrin-2 dehydrogenase n=2 Tax=Shouchella clausii TaxID=79880 RepID=A0A268NZ46_SHOCL|nr:hypothetical protein CHH72_12880 [Shouchella clausii]